MSFEIMTWAAGFAMTKAIQQLAQSLFTKNLNKELALAATRWAAQLPAGHELIPEALFPRVPDDNELLDRPALKIVRDRLVTKRIPSLIEWHLAFIEQWQKIRELNGADTQPFFRLAENDARADLHALARGVLQACEQDEALFKGTVLEKLAGIRLATLSDNDIPAPYNWQDAPSMRELANTIERISGAQVAQLLTDYATRRLCVWSTVPGTGFPEFKKTLIRIACIASGHPDIDHIDIGIFKGLDVQGSDARGPIGIAKLRFDAKLSHALAISKEESSAYWDHVKYYIIANDNSDSQFWQELPLGNLESLI